MDFLNKILKTKYKKVFTTDKRGLCVPCVFKKDMPQIKQILTDFSLCPFCTLVPLWFKTLPLQH